MRSKYRGVRGVSTTSPFLASKCTRVPCLIWNMARICFGITTWLSYRPWRIPCVLSLKRLNRAGSPDQRGGLLGLPQRHSNSNAVCSTEFPRVKYVSPEFRNVHNDTFPDRSHPASTKATEEARGSRASTSRLWKWRATRGSSCTILLGISNRGLFVIALRSACTVVPASATLPAYPMANLGPRCRIFCSRSSK